MGGREKKATTFNSVAFINQGGEGGGGKGKDER